MGVAALTPNWFLSGTVHSKVPSPASTPNPCADEQLAIIRRPPSANRIGELCDVCSSGNGGVAHTVSPVCLSKCGHQSLCAARRHDHMGSIDQQALAQRPRDILGLKPLTDVDGPQQFAVGRVKTCQATMRVEVIQPAIRITATGSRSGIRACPGISIGRPPQQTGRLDRKRTRQVRRRCRP